MMNHKEIAIVKTQTEARDAAMKSARHWAGSELDKYLSAKSRTKYTRDAVKNARKANAKIVAAKAAGSARPVGLVLAAVLPLMETMTADAAERAMKHVTDTRAKVAAESLDIAFPEPTRPAWNDYNRQRRAEYDRAVARRAFAARVSYLVEGCNVEEFVTNYVANEVFAARAQFLAFADKLTLKVGAITEAKLQTLRGVWGESYLYVTTAEGVAQCWKTQTIVNRSVLDNLFYQWPTRIVKM